MHPSAARETFTYAVFVVIGALLGCAAIALVVLLKRYRSLGRLLLHSKSNMRKSPPISPEGSSSEGSVCELANCKTHLLAEPLTRRHARDSRESLDGCLPFVSASKPPPSEGRILLRVLSKQDRASELLQMAPRDATLATSRWQIWCATGRSRI